MDTSGDINEGLLESVVTQDLERRLESVLNLEIDTGKVDPADQTHVLTRHLSAALERRLASVKDPRRKLAVANELLALIDAANSRAVDPLQELLAIRRAPGPGQISRFQLRPKTPLNDAALLTNAHGEPSLASELKAEIDSADSVDLLCAFVMWRGLRLLEEPLRKARAAGVPIRVVTTTYIGGTEREAWIVCP